MVKRYVQCSEERDYRLFPARIRMISNLSNSCWLFVLLFHHVLPSHSCFQYHASTSTPGMYNAKRCKMISDGKRTADWSLKTTEQTVPRSRNPWRKRWKLSWIWTLFSVCVVIRSFFFVFWLIHDIDLRTVGSSRPIAPGASIEDFLVWRRNIGGLPEPLLGLLSLFRPTWLSSRSAMYACIPASPLSAFWSCLALYGALISF